MLLLFIFLLIYATEFLLLVLIIIMIAKLFEISGMRVLFLLWNLSNWPCIMSMNSWISDDFVHISKDEDQFDPETHFGVFPICTCVLRKALISVLPQRFSPFCPSSWLLDGHSLSTEWRTDLLSRVSTVLKMEMGAIHFCTQALPDNLGAWSLVQATGCVAQALAPSGWHCPVCELLGSFGKRNTSSCLQTILWLSTQPQISKPY